MADKEYDENYYKKKTDELNAKLADPVISKKLEGYLSKISKMMDCDLDVAFMVLPHFEKYSEVQDSEEYRIPDLRTMNLSTLIDHLNKESDGDLNVYIDPIFLKKGLNEIIDVLITTRDSNMIIVPISTKKIE